MSLNLQRANTPDDVAGPAASNGGAHVVLTVLDHVDARPELRHVLQLNGYRVIDTDNGQDAARNARQIHPDLLVVDMDVPLLYELVAARQIIKHAQVGPLPVVIVTHEDVVDPAPMMEVGATRDEYVTRLSDYQELKHLLDYLLPILPPTSDARLVTQRIFARTRRRSGKELLLPMSCAFPNKALGIYLLPDRHPSFLIQFPSATQRPKGRDVGRFDHCCGDIRTGQNSLPKVLRQKRAE